MSQKWTANAQAKLLTGILTVLDVKMGHEGFEKLADYMGPDFSWNGVRQYIQKVKAGVNATKATNGAPNSRTSSVKKPKTTPKKRGKTLADSPADDADDEVPTPSKRAKKQHRASALKAEALIKQAEEAELADEQEEAELARRRGNGGGSDVDGQEGASRATKVKTEPEEESEGDEAFGGIGEGQGQGIQDPFGGQDFELQEDGDSLVAQDNFPGFTPVNAPGGQYGYDLEEFGFGGFGGSI